MNKLESAMQRLYCLPGQAMEAFKLDQDKPVIELVSASGLVRCFVISVEKGGDWAQVAGLYRGVQEDLELPAPAISVSVEDGYQIWFSMAEPILSQLAEGFMEALSRQYLAETKAAKIKYRPGRTDTLRSLPLVPAKQGDTERWSAFIDPTMGSMFVAETWLEMAPSLDRQAGMLASLECIKAPDFQRARSILRLLPEGNAKSSGPLPLEPKIEPAQIERQRSAGALSVGNNFTSPQRFLLAVMNDPAASAEQRITAAVALLPFCEKNADCCP